MKKYKLLKKHISDCLAVKNAESGKWRSPWCLGAHEHDVYFADCYVFICNDPECAAAISVRTEVLEEFVYKIQKEEIENAV